MVVNHKKEGRIVEIDGLYYRDEHYQVYVDMEVSETLTALTLNWYDRKNLFKIGEL